MGEKIAELELEGSPSAFLFGVLFGWLQCGLDDDLDRRSDDTDDAQAGLLFHWQLNHSGRPRPLERSLDRSHPGRRSLQVKTLLLYCKAPSLQKYARN